MSTSDIRQKIIVILGQNASGKSSLAVELARKFKGEIISADSRQVYRGMNIGTGKVSKDKSKIKNQKSKFQIKIQNEFFHKGIRHHLLDVAGPKRRFTVAQYKLLTLKAIKDIQKRGKLPIICGGTGFYIQAITDNISIPEVKPDFKFRAKLEKKSADQLFNELKKRDPNRARNIDRYNKRRLIRALEIVLKTGRPVPPLVIPACASPKASARRAKAGIQTQESGFRVKPGMTNNEFDTLFLGVKKSPRVLKKLIYVRLLKRLNQGMIKEVQKLRNSGISWKRLDDFGLEYRWIARYLQKQVSREKMIYRLQKEIEHYAKRQIVWFKKNKRINWVKKQGHAEKLIKDFLKK